MGSSELLLGKIKKSGLDATDAKKLQFKNLERTPPRITPEKIQPCFVIPYHDVRGKPTGFFRVRLLDDPKAKASGFDAAVKPLRYLQPPNSGVHAYFPRTVANWQQIIDDARQPLFITEGELKAACSCKHGYPTVGLGGVYSWRSARGEHDLIPDLDAIKWEQRPTYIVFDSDVATKPQVAAALRHLCNVLTSRGAIPFVVQLPDADEGKTGLDDLLVSKDGPATFDKLIKSAEPFGAAKALWRMNDEVCFVQDPGFVLKLDTMQRMASAAFVREHFVNRTHVEVSDTSKGPKLTQRKTAEAWLQWRYRRQCERLTYAPGQPALVGEAMNTWKGSGVDPVKGDVKPWQELLDYVFEDDKDARTWFERWCAYPFQRPGTKMLSAVVIWGVHQGTGKTLLCYTLKRLYGDHNVSEITQDHLRSHYNDWLVDKQLVIGEEITGNDRRADADRIKALITQESVRVSSKYIREYTVPALANLFFTSNHPDAFFLEDTDRRFFVHELRSPPRDRAFYQRYDKWYKSAAGLAALLHHFMHLDLGDFNPDERAMETRAKREMIEDNKSDLAAWVNRLKREPKLVLQETGMPPNATVLMAPQLLAMYDAGQSKRVTANGLGREMKRALFWRVIVNLKRKGEWYPHLLYVVQDRARLANMSPPQIAAEWIKHFGDDDQKSEQKRETRKRERKAQRKGGDK